MSVAIIPMAQEFGWSPSVSGIVQSAFFYGYMASQLPAGYLANRFSGRWLLPVGVGTWSFFTAAVPAFATSVPSLCLSRSAVGFGEGVAPSAVNDLVVKAVPKRERARAISTRFGGLHIGSIAGFLLAPPLITKFGWQAVFYVFGALGLVWIAIFETFLRIFWHIFQGDFITIRLEFDFFSEMELKNFRNSFFFVLNLFQQLNAVMELSP